MAESVLTVRDLKKTFRPGLRSSLMARPVEVLKGVSFDIEPGTITGFLGANGAGKTTTIKCLLNLAWPDSGQIRFFGSNDLTPDIRARIGFLPERPYFYEYLTGREFLRFYGQLSLRLARRTLDERIEELLARVQLTRSADRPLRGYSKGMLQRIGIAQALIHAPEFVILDEPMTGLDPDGRHEVREIIRETAEAGTAVFFSSHLLPDAEEICGRLVILKQGVVAFEGPTATFLGRLEKGYRVGYFAQGVLSESSCADLRALQLEIDRLRASGAEIREVKSLRPTLEEAFMKLAFDEKEVRA